MNKLVTLFAIILVLLIACELQEEPKKEPFCGDNICQDNEKESGCAADCDGFEDITKLQCTQAGGKWSDCGSPCAGTDSEFCIAVCSPQCECNDAKFRCPDGFKCRLSGKKVDEIGVCVKG